MFSSHDPAAVGSNPNIDAFLYVDSVTGPVAVGSNPIEAKSTRLYRNNVKDMCYTS